MSNKIEARLAKIRERAESLKGVYEAETSLPAYTRPGGYTIIYVTQAGDEVCAGCATLALDNQDEYVGEDLPVDYFAYDEGPVMFCDWCNSELAPSYGDPDEPTA